MTKRLKPSAPPNPAAGQSKPESGWPKPEPGDVLSYAYLWSHEVADGQEEGRKDRPVVVVLATVGQGDGLRIIVAPVTHSRPSNAANALELPQLVKRDLRLDDAQSWIVTTEVNSFRWPGPDLRITHTGNPFYGAIPDWLFVKVNARIGALAREGAIKITRRTE